MEIAVSCVIIEDDTVAAAMAADILQSNFSEIQVLATIPDIKTAKEQLVHLQPDFILLDVNLSDGDAFTLLSALDHIPFKIVFTTSFDTYALEAFKYSALDYVLKPYAPEDLVGAITKVLAQLKKENYGDQMATLFHNMKTQNLQDKRLVLKNLDVIHIVTVSDITHIQSDNNYATFYLNDGKDIVVSKTLKFYEEQLKGQRFFRVHQSYLINLKYIASFDKRTDTVLLHNGVSLPVSKSKKKHLFDYLKNLS